MTTAVGNNNISQTVLDSMNPQGSTTQSTAEAQQDQFLKLLVTQMQNQDPLNPMDNAQVTSQLAQLSTVTGIDKLNVTLQSLMGSYQSNQSLQATSLINHGVLAPGKGMTLAENTADDGTVTKQAIMGIDLPQDVDSAIVTIKDQSGNTVATMDLGKQPAGTQPLMWDGKKTDGTSAAAGSYTFDVQATVGGTKVDATALQFGIVTTVSTAAGVEPKVNVPGLGSVNFSDIRQIL
jgi:flagellar basal-body rod modification protein FlgD